MSHFTENNSHGDWMNTFTMGEADPDMHPIHTQHSSALAPSQSASPFPPALQQMQPSGSGPGSPQLMPSNLQAHPAHHAVHLRRGSTQGTLAHSRSLSQSRLNPGQRISIVDTVNKLVERMVDVEARVNQRYACHVHSPNESVLTLLDRDQAAGTSV
jgi:hypothetical protein